MAVASQRYPGAAPAHAPPINTLSPRPHAQTQLPSVHNNNFSDFNNNNNNMNNNNNNQQFGVVGMPAPVQASEYGLIVLQKPEEQHDDADNSSVHNSNSVDHNNVDRAAFGVSTRSAAAVSSSSAVSGSGVSHYGSPPRREPLGGVQPQTQQALAGVHALGGGEVYGSRPVAPNTSQRYGAGPVPPSPRAASPRAASPPLARSAQYASPTPVRTQFARADTVTQSYIFLSSVCVFLHKRFTYLCYLFISLF